MQDRIRPWDKYDSEFSVIVLTRQSMVGEMLVDLLVRKEALKAVHVHCVADLSGEDQNCQAADIVLVDSLLIDPAGMKPMFDRIKAACVQSRIVVLADDTHRGQDFDYIDAGASGVAIKSRTLGSLVNMLRFVRSGETCVPLDPRPSSPAGQGESPDAFRRNRPPAPLTPNQKAIFTLLAKGLSNSEIAAVSGKAPPTVKMHIAAIMRKLGVDNRTQAVVLGLQKGLA